jgi:ferredoxin-NADP reductase
MDSICGSVHFVREMPGSLERMGVERGRIHLEPFDVEEA